MFPLADLDLDRLFDNLATRKADLAQYEGIVAGLKTGDEQVAWASEAERVRAEVVELEELIAAKKEFDRGAARTG